MKRKDFLKGIGLGSALSFVPFKSVLADTGKTQKTSACTLIPSETAGPYPLDLSADSTKFRSVINETKTGVPHTVKLKIISTTDCNPIANARVDIWHCDKDGYYSGYDGQPGYLGTQNNKGQTFCRGIQLTDVKGEVIFETIFPGWYPGRICHIHFQIFLSSVLQATSQLTFPEATKNSIYTTNALYSAHGADPVTLATDSIFSDGYAYQMATLTPNSSGGYDSYLEIAINAASTGLIKLEPETGGQFKLRQNFPNPYQGKTSIPFSLNNPSDIKLEFYDLMGRKAGEILKSGLETGDHEIEVDINNLGMAHGNYVYQLEVSNKNGSFRQCKLMSAR